MTDPHYSFFTDAGNAAAHRYVRLARINGPLTRDQLWSELRSMQTLLAEAGHVEAHDTACREAMQEALEAPHDPPVPLDTRRHWIAASAAVDQAQRMLQDASLTLPLAPADGICPACNASDWEIQESGFTQGCRAHLVPEDDDGPAAWCSWTDGTSDFSDDGDGAVVLVCTHHTVIPHPTIEGVHQHSYCGLAYRCPSDLIWS